jgi:hypothetical protein
MIVTKLENGQFEVKHENLTLVQTVINGTRYNDCTIEKDGLFEGVSEYDERFKPLFIALHNYKSNL